MIAVIPLDAVKAATYVLQEVVILEGTPLAVNQGHGMIKVTFDRDVEFYEQVGAAERVFWSENFRELLFSFEVSTLLRSNDDPKEYFQALTAGRFPLVGGVFTQNGFENTHAGNVFHEFPLRMNADQAANYVSRFISRAERNGTRKEYTIDRHNCITEMFDVLDSFYTSPSANTTDIAAESEGVWMPTEVPKALRARGLL